MKMVKELIKKYNQFLKFAIIGASNSLIAIVVYHFYLYVINKPFLFISSLNIAYFLSFIFSVYNGYYFSKKFVFKEDSKGSMAKFYLQYFITFLIGLVLINLFVGVGIHETPAQILQIAVTCIINFLGSKYFVFK